MEKRAPPTFLGAGSHSQDLVCSCQEHTPQQCGRIKAIYKIVGTHYELSSGADYGNDNMCISKCTCHLHDSVMPLKGIPYQPSLHILQCYTSSRNAPQFPRIPALSVYSQCKRKDHTATQQQHIKDTQYTLYFKHSSRSIQHRNFQYQTQKTDP